MKFIEELDVTNKKVILRLDLNVTIKEGKIVDDTKIRKSIPTIKYLLNKGANLLIMSHLGKVKTEEDKKENTLLPVCNRLSELLSMDIIFIKDTRDERIKDYLNDNRLVMLENTRHEDLPSSLESGCDDELAKFWASLGDVFVNDAFGTTHRRHASNAGIAKYLPNGYGFLIKEELEGLDPIINNIERPFVVIMGGAKVDDKVALIESLINKCDYILVGGGIANTFLKAKGYEVGESLYSKDYVDKIKVLIENNINKIITPVDVVVKDNNSINTINIEEVSTTASIYDIGEKTCELYKQYIDNAATVFMNGTVGLYEDENYRHGTEFILKELEQTDCNKIAGGGDAVASVNKLGYENAFDFLSTGGGATLDYIASGKLKCYEVE